MVRRIGAADLAYVRYRWHCARVALVGNCKLIEPVTMEVHTTRFGCLTIEADDVIHFPTGLRGLEDCRDWVLLADANNDALGWLQSTNHDAVALAVVSPRKFVPGHQVRVVRQELFPLGVDALDRAYVLVIVSKNERGITLNLKAPLIINLDRRVGHQVVASGDQPLQYALSCESPPRKKIA